VFDKYERRFGLNAKKLLQSLLREMKTLTKLQRLIVVGVSPSILRKAVKLVLKYHTYIADTLQIASAIKSKSNKFVTGDRNLANIAKAEGLKILYLG